MKVKFMKIAINLALKGLGFTSPNPMVGAVIVKKGRIIGKGYHRGYGLPHAEIEAIKDCKEDTKGSTMFVTLEPCVHFGKTPPCAPEIVKAGIKKVYVSMIDPNPVVNGKGIEYLKKNDIDVEVGLLEDKAREINKFYIHYIINKIPFVILKMASTIDGFIGDEDRNIKRISSKESIKLVHKWRYEVDGVMVGIGTIIKDNPKLNIRYFKRKKPLKKIILDYYLRIPETAEIFKTEGETIIFTKEKNRNLKCEVIEVDGNNGMLDIFKIIKILGEKGITSLMVEGGKCIFSSFINSDLFNEIRLFISPRFIGNGIRLTEGNIDTFVDIKKIKKIENNILLIGEKCSQV